MISISQILPIVKQNKQLVVSFAADIVKEPSVLKDLAAFKAGTLTLTQFEQAHTTFVEEVGQQIAQAIVENPEILAAVLALATGGE